MAWTGTRPRVRSSSTAGNRAAEAASRCAASTCNPSTWRKPRRSALSSERAIPSLKNSHPLRVPRTPCSRASRTIWAGVVAVILLLAGITHAAERKPNIVLIVADDLGIRRLRCPGIVQRRLHAQRRFDCPQRRALHQRIRQLSGLLPHPRRAHDLVLPGALRPRAQSRRGRPGKFRPAAGSDHHAETLKSERISNRDGRQMASRQSRGHAADQTRV